MIDLQGKNSLVVGMAKSGIASAKLLHKNGARVAVNDCKGKEDLKAVLDELPFAEDFLGKPVGACIKGMDLIVLSPGVPMSGDWVYEAQSEGCIVIGEIELASWFIEAPIVAITGTNGKTTTTALTGEIFKNAGKTTHVIGNIGIPMAERAPDIQPDDVVVAEVAGFQLESTISFRPKACAILNITPDHLDRFGDMETYTDAKAMVYRNMNSGDFVILNADNGITASLAATNMDKGYPYQQKIIFKHLETQFGMPPEIPMNLNKKYLWFSIKQECHGAYVKNGDIILNIDKPRALCKASEVRIPGEHNLQNALAASLLAAVMGVSDGVIADTLKTFAGVEHRIEFVREVNGVKYINDSKGTNTDASVKAIQAMTSPTVLIAGGYDKHADFTELIQSFKDTVTDAVVLGQTADQLLKTAYDLGFTNIHKADGFKEAVMTASHLAKPGYNVLLSPACASWDMFEDFEQRGRTFKDIVESMIE